MVKDIVFSAACLFILGAAQAVAAKPNGARQAQPSATSKAAPLPLKLRLNRPTWVDFGDGRLALQQQDSRARGAPQLFGALVPAENVVLGVGVWRVQKINDVDPNRANPMRDPRGRTTRVAAVGLKLSF